MTNGATLSRKGGVVSSHSTPSFNWRNCMSEVGLSQTNNIPIPGTLTENAYLPAEVMKFGNGQVVC